MAKMHVQKHTAKNANHKCKKNAGAKAQYFSCMLPGFCIFSKIMFV
jgi:hypothetical protein